MSLVYWENPTGQVTNSELAPSVSVIHHVLMVDCCDVLDMVQPKRSPTISFSGMYLKSCILYKELEFMY